MKNAPFQALTRQLPQKGARDATETLLPFSLREAAWQTP